ncbi:ADP-ribosylglycohydrolase family protein [Paenibacillus sp. CF384]|uniref:ADP-ribosylglycohydrolase family protein n=1 Tax=Paenibacillus sp. CF384 TaxID=1884382 RepID=UPI000895D39E|nr:ADP-ribosylglycohydrolase family protein [Paenibacillus sp. CF384]SDW16303.1 ADP-ribosylglycohydrolase [Paenibacillus sp. CF384]
MSEAVSLQDKFYGCIAGAHVGAALGAPAQGLTWQGSEAAFGVLDQLKSYENGWIREAGTTGSGIERQKLLITAISERQDRVTAEDVRAIWVSDMAMSSAEKIMEPFDISLLAVANSGIPARDLGKYCDYAGLNSFAGYCHPVGLINAGDVLNAIRDAFELGQLYYASRSYGVKWSGVTAAAIASATKPGATIDSVIQDLISNCVYSDVGAKIDGYKYGYLRDNVVDELESGLKLTEGCRDFRELREAFDKSYRGCGVPYGNSFANEVVTKAICIVRMVNANVHDAIIAGANMGRDSVSVAALAGGLAGAISGAATLPESLIQQVDDAAGMNNYTCTQQTIREQADGVYQAFQSRLSTINKLVEEMLV